MRRNDKAVVQMCVLNKRILASKNGSRPLISGRMVLWSTLGNFEENCDTEAT